MKNKSLLYLQRKRLLMMNIFEALKDNPLFSGIAYGEFEKVLGCLAARTSCYQKDEVILLTGDDVTFVGLIISGGVKIVKEDEFGRVSMLTELRASEMFGEILACAGIQKSPVTILALKDTEILRIGSGNILTPCATACPYHGRLIENMLRHIAGKSFLLNRKIEILSQRTTREKLLCFFDLHRGGLRRFTVPYNREEMAHYLCVDRSAMSNELCKMRDEGLISFKKNQFEILI